MKVAALKVPPVRLRVALPFALFAAPVAMPLICRMPTVAVPPVWLKVPVVASAVLLSERAICRVEVAAMFKVPLLRLKTPVAPVFVPMSTPTPPATVLRVPPLRL